MGIEEIRPYLDEVAAGIRREIKLASEGMQREVRATNYRITELSNRVQNVESMCFETRADLRNAKENLNKQDSQLDNLRKEVIPLVKRVPRREADHEDSNFISLRSGDSTLRTILFTILKTVGWIGLAILGAAEIYQVIRG